MFPRHVTMLGIGAYMCSLMFACAAWGAQEAARPAAPDPLIPRAVLFGNPDRASPQISPDGKQLAYLAPLDGVLNVFVTTIDKPEGGKAVTRDKVRGIRQHFWAYTSGHVLYIQDKGGDENWRVYCVDIASGTEKDLTPVENTTARILAVSHKFPREILIGLNDRKPEFHDVYRVNIVTGERTLAQPNDEGFARFVSDDDYRVRMAARFTPDGGGEILRAAAGKWTDFVKVGNEDAMTTSAIGFDKAGSTLYMLDSRGRDTAALVSINVDSASPSPTVLASDARADVDDVMIHPTQRNVQAAAFNYERKKWQIIDKSIQADFDYLQTVADGDFEIASRTLDDSQWIVEYVLDDGPVRYYRYDRPARKAHFLFTNRKALEGVKLAKMRPVVIPARDGQKLVSYYTLPTWADPGRDGKPASPLPMVLFVHGGPWARDEWGLNAYHQWLANRGYAVLSVNYRGSTGFGKQFINAGNMEWAGKMHNDLLDAVEWAVGRGIADRARVGIMGGSYGGYATLVGLTFTPEVFACGVDIVGPSNLETLLNSIPPYWAPIVNLFTSRVGDHRTEEGRKLLNARSPLNRVDRIRRPLLIGQGANDPRVKQSESDQIVRAMSEKKIPVGYVLFPDEGHGFARPENRMAFNAVTEAFLAEHLKGRYEPIGEDLKGSSITVPHGAEQVPGLKEAMAAQ